MNNHEAIEMMHRCRDEIRMLRRHIDALTPKAEAYDVLAKTINAMAPRPSIGMGEDVAWALDKRIAELQKEIASPAAEAPTADAS